LQTFLFHANILGRVAAAWAGVPHCVSGIRVAERRSKWPLRLDRLTNRFVDFHVCVSQAVADFSADVAGLPRARLSVIPNGVDVATYAAADPADRQALGLPQDAYVVLAVGRLDPQKGLHHLFDAARGLLPRFPELHFVLVGDGPLHSELKARAEQAPLTGRIHLTGWRPDVPSLLKMGDALVLPSLWEGMPNVVLEAMAAGLPVVASRVEGVAELVIPEQTGLLVSPGAAGELESAISRLLADPERGRVMGRNGQVRVSAHFSWETMVERYVSLYEHLLG
jgi:starch synthase (maltosyl-transferring)